MGIMVNGLYILELHESVRQRGANVASISSGKHSRSDGADFKHLRPIEGLGGDINVSALMLDLDVI